MDSPWNPSGDLGPYCASPFMGQAPCGASRGGLNHTAQLGDHVQALLLAQVLRTHNRLLVEQVAGASLLLQVTLDHVDGPIHFLAGDLLGPLVSNGYRHLFSTSSPRRFGDAPTLRL